MVAGISYNEAKAMFRKRSWSSAGISNGALDHQLTRCGFSVARIYPEKGRPWPPIPFAPVHIARVRPAGMRKSKWDHWVVWDEDGVVWDPDNSNFHDLSQYGKVFDVNGLYRIPTYRKVSNPASPHFGEVIR